MPYILTIILSFILAHPVWANTHFTVSDKTFFFHHRLDRIYFDPNGEFQQQLESQYGAIKSGELLKGQWQFNETRMELCMDYTQPQLNKICMDMIENKNEDGGYSVFDKSGQLHFKWYNMRHGNWLLSQEGMKMLSASLNGDKKSNTAPLDESITQYIDGKILSGFGEELFYFKDNSQALYRDNNTQTVKSSRYTIDNFVLVGKDNNGIELYNIMATLGEEFLNKKPKNLYFYATSDFFLIEGEGEFDLTPINESPDKDIFIEQ